MAAGTIPAPAVQLELLEEATKAAASRQKTDHCTPASAVAPIPCAGAGGAKGARRGELPEEVQLLFDQAKALERGRRGRQLGNMVRPDLKASLEAYAVAFGALDSFKPCGNAAAVDRIRARYRQLEAATAARIIAEAAPLLPFDEACRAQAVFRFDLGLHDLVGATKRVLESDGQLDQLHTRPLTGKPPLSPALLAAFARGTKVPKEWGFVSSRRKEHIRQFRRAPEYKEWIDVYRRFVEDVVAPLVDDPRGIAFQCPPTLRCQLPGTRPLGHSHRDDEYEGHQGEEINFWLPLTRTWGSNTLHVESSPGRGDFKPLELSYGDLFRFHGGQCEHYTLANDTGFTRVSLDFRVIPRSVWRNEFGGRIGEYPCETTQL